MQFQRSITPLSLLLVSVGGMLGSGWLFGALLVSKLAGPVGIFSWMIGGLLMLFVALTFAELTTMFPVAGGMVRFAEFSHGPTVNFMIAWTAYVATIGAAPIETMSILQYASNYLPHLMHDVNGTMVLGPLGFVCASLLMMLMCFLNRAGVKFFSKLNNLLVLIKISVPILTIIVLLTTTFNFKNLVLSGFIPYGWKSVFAALPLGGVIFSFMGFEAAIQLAEEAKNPQRAIPLAIIGSLVIAIVIYMLLQLAFIGAITPNYLTHGWQQLSFPHASGPFAGLATILGLSWLAYLIYIDAAYSPFTSAFIFTTTTARLTYGLAESGIFPKWLQKLNRNGAPMNAIIFNYAIGLTFFLPFPTWQGMVGFLVSCIVISYSIGPLSLIALRYNQPQIARPFRLPYPLLFCLLAFYICNLIIFWTGWHTISRALIAIAIGYIFFFRQHSQWKTAWWILPFLAGIGVISYLGSFGDGKNILTFGKDFLVIASFSTIIFVLSIRCALQQHPR